MGGGGAPNPLRHIPVHGGIGSNMYTEFINDDCYKYG